MALITNAAGTYIADVDSSGRQLVQPPTDGTNAGAVFLVGKPDLSSPSNTGSITGSSQGLLGMARVELDFDLNFVASAVCTTNLSSSGATMTASIAANTQICNTAGTLTAGSYFFSRTYRHFKVERGADRIFAIRARLDQAPIANNTVDFGAGVISGASSPTAGVFFRINSAGELRGVSITAGGSETTTGVLTFTNPTDFHDFVIVIGRSSVTFFIDEIPVAALDAPGDSTGPAAVESFPMFYRIQNNAAVGTAQKLYVAKLVSATMGGVSNRSAAELAALKGDIGLQQVVGVGGGGQTANWTNSAVPATATLSNTAGGYATLGGNFLFVALAAAETDYALFAYLNPSNSSLTNMARTLIIRGISIDAFVSVAGGTPTVASVLHWGFAFGSSAVSLATAETTSVKQPRRGFLGMQSVPIGAVAGQELRRISQTFAQPLAVHPGEYFHIILRIPLGAATTYPTIRGGVFIDASWE